MKVVRRKEQHIYIKGMISRGKDSLVNMCMLDVCCLQLLHQEEPHIVALRWLHIKIITKSAQYTSENHHESIHVLLHECQPMNKQLKVLSEK